MYGTPNVTKIITRLCALYHAILIVCGRDIRTSSDRDPMCGNELSVSSEREVQWYTQCRLAYVRGAPL